MEELFLQPYDAIEEDTNGVFTLRIWAHDRASNRVLLRVEDFKPYCRIELPKFVDGKLFKWTKSEKTLFFNWLTNALSYNEDHAPDRIKAQKLRKLYWYKTPENALSQFVICYFNNLESLSHCVNLLKKPRDIKGLGLVQSTVMEQAISQTTRLFVDANLNRSQWFSVKAERVDDEDDKLSLNEHEYIAESWETITPIDPNETSDWIVGPSVGAIDIETNSENENRFPHALNLSDACFQISFVFQKNVNDKSTREQFLLCLNGCSPIEGATIIECSHEVELFHELCKLIQKKQPTILTGYNIFKFDYMYIKDRLDIFQEDLLSVGYIKDQPSRIASKQWRSGAYGFVTISSITGEGLLNIDMYPLIKRDHPGLRKHSLDFVANHFLGHGKHDVTAKQMFRAYKSLRAATKEKNKKKIKACQDEMARIGAYCLVDSCLPIDLMMYLNTWIALTEMSNIMCVSAVETFSRGQQVRVTNQFYKFASKQNFVLDQRAEMVMEYAGGHVEQPVVGVHKDMLVFDFNSMYPNIIIGYNICHTTLVPPEMDIPDEQCNVIEWDEEAEDGSNRHFRFRWIKAEIFEGLLPRMCRDLIVERKAVRKLIGPNNTAMKNEILNQRQLSIKVAANSIYGSLGAKTGKLNLFEGAASVTAMGRRLIKESGKYAEDNYGGKVIFGDTDSFGATFPHLTDYNQAIDFGIKLADEITALFPDSMILEFEKMFGYTFLIKKKMYIGVYVDSVKMNSSTKITEVPSQLDEFKCYKLETDGKTKYMGLPHGKENSNPERFDGITFTKDGKPEDSRILKKGILIVRRDKTGWVKHVYTQLYYNILFGLSLDKSIQYIIDEMVKVKSFQVPFEDFTITKQIGANYSPDSTCDLKLFQDKMKEMGTPVESGERLEILYVNSEKAEDNAKVGLKMRTIEAYQNNREKERIDTQYYILKHLEKPISMIMNIAYRKEIQEIEQRAVEQREQQFEELEQKLLAKADIEYRDNKFRKRYGDVEDTQNVKAMYKLPKSIEQKVKVEIRKRKKSQLKTYCSENFIENMAKVFEAKNQVCREIQTRG